MATLASPAHQPAHGDLTIGTHATDTLLIGGTVGTKWWDVAWVDDPVDGVAGSGDATPNDYKRATYYVSWRQGTTPDTIILTRTLSAP